jgi:hypothetical protein
MAEIDPAGSAWGFACMATLDHLLPVCFRNCWAEQARLDRTVEIYMETAPYMVGATGIEPVTPTMST